MERNPKTSRISKQQETAAKADVQFLPDSSEQIEESMESLGSLWNQLHIAFQEAIDRVNKGQQESNQPATYETKKVTRRVRLR